MDNVVDRLDIAMAVPLDVDPGYSREYEPDSVYDTYLYYIEGGLDKAMLPPLVPDLGRRRQHRQIDSSCCGLRQYSKAHPLDVARQPPGLPIKVYNCTQPDNAKDCTPGCYGRYTEYMVSEVCKDCTHQEGCVRTIIKQRRCND